MVLQAPPMLLILQSLLPENTPCNVNDTRHCVLLALYSYYTKCNGLKQRILATKPKRGEEVLNVR